MCWLSFILLAVSAIMEVKMNTLLATVGLPMSGKTTWAKGMSKEEGYPVIDPYLMYKYVFPNKHVTEESMGIFALTLIGALFLSGHKTIVLDACNIIKETRKRWLSSLWNTEFVLIDQSMDVCMARARADKNDVVIPIIEDMSLRFEMLEESESFRVVVCGENI